MAFINNNYGDIKVDKQVNITTTPPDDKQHSDKPASDADTDADAEKDPNQLSNRQIVIMMTALMNISLSKEYTNQKQLARLLSSITGRSMQSIRQTIMKLANEGIETTEAKRDCNIAADALEPFCMQIAQRLRNDAVD